MAANFSPYQDTPEASRALSPPPLHSPRPSTDRSRPSLDRTTHTTRTPTYHDYFQPSPPPSHTPSRSPSPSTTFLHPRTTISMFNTSLSIPLDYEASAAYLLLPPAGAVLLLILEHQSDYVRFHAWQTATLDRYEVPFFGPLASSILDDE
ncbi:hypothetical protein Alg130_09223 [Pyrenophora tritici-repentis]|nr:hypothetical protein Alg130_09223 [Pyrenophora tritici-repentis]KAI1587218.1 hypothetical protein PtrEW13061_007284 [Pyrenophora tritici-repentis]KAI1679423.1 hypothetical protein KJE20_11605 [Pyrenophora tritici-repentis]